MAIDQGFISDSEYGYESLEVDVPLLHSGGDSVISEQKDDSSSTRQYGDSPDAVDSSVEQANQVIDLFEDWPEEPKNGITGESGEKADKEGARLADPNYDVARQNVPEPALQYVPDPTAPTSGRRSLRPRTVIQLHPYTLEMQRYKMTLRQSGVRPVRVQEQEEEKPSRENVSDRGEDSDPLYSQESQHVTQTGQQSQPETASQTDPWQYTSSPVVFSSQSSNEMLDEEEEQVSRHKRRRILTSDDERDECEYDHEADNVHILDDSESEEVEEESQLAELTRFRKKLMGVLPPSFITLEYAQFRRNDSVQKRLRRERPAVDIDQKGVAKRKIVRRERTMDQSGFGDSFQNDSFPSTQQMENRESVLNHDSGDNNDFADSDRFLDHSIVHDESDSNDIQHDVCEDVLAPRSQVVDLTLDSHSQPEEHEEFNFMTSYQASTDCRSKSSRRGRRTQASIGWPRTKRNNESQCKPVARKSRHNPPKVSHGKSHTLRAMSRNHQKQCVRTIELSHGLWADLAPTVPLSQSMKRARRSMEQVPRFMRIAERSVIRREKAGHRSTRSIAEQSLNDKTSLQNSSHKILKPYIRPSAPDMQLSTIRNVKPRFKPRLRENSIPKYSEAQISDHLREKYLGSPIYRTPIIETTSGKYVLRRQMSRQSLSLSDLLKRVQIEAQPTRDAVPLRNKSREPEQLLSAKQRMVENWIISGSTSHNLHGDKLTPLPADLKYSTDIVVGKALFRQIIGLSPRENSLISSVDFGRGNRFEILQFTDSLQFEIMLDSVLDMVESESRNAIVENSLSNSSSRTVYNVFQFLLAGLCCPQVELMSHFDRDTLTIGFLDKLITHVAMLWNELNDMSILQRLDHPFTNITVTLLYFGILLSMSLPQSAKVLQLIRRCTRLLVDFFTNTSNAIIRVLRKHYSSLYRTVSSDSYIFEAVTVTIAGASRLSEQLNGILLQKILSSHDPVAIQEAIFDVVYIFAAVAQVSIQLGVRMVELWPAVGALAKTLPYTTPSERKKYLFHCLRLVNVWKWSADRTLMLIIFKHFAQNNYLNMDQNISDVNFNFSGLFIDGASTKEPSFHLFLRYLVKTIEFFKCAKDDSALRKLVGQVTPLNGHVYNNSAELKMQDLESLANQYKLLLTLFYQCPNDLRPSVGQLMDVIILEDSHIEARLMSFNAWNALTDYLLEQGEDPSQASGWLDSILKCSIREYGRLEQVSDAVSKGENERRQHNLDNYTVFFRKLFAALRKKFQSKAFLRSKQSWKLVTNLLHAHAGQKISQDFLYTLKEYMVFCDDQVVASRTESFEDSQDEDSLKQFIDEQNCLSRSEIALHIFEDLYEPFHQYLSRLFGSDSVPETLVASLSIDVWVAMSKFLVESRKMAVVDGRYSWKWFPRANSRISFEPLLLTRILDSSQGFVGSEDTFISYLFDMLCRVKMDYLTIFISALRQKFSIPWLDRITNTHFLHVGEMDQWREKTVKGEFALAIRLLTNMKNTYRFLEGALRDKYMKFVVKVMSWVFEYCGTTNCQCDALKWFEEVQRDNETIYAVLNIGKLKNYTGKDFSLESQQLKFAHYIIHSLEYYVSQKSVTVFYSSVAQSLIDSNGGREIVLDTFQPARKYFLGVLSLGYLIAAKESLTRVSLGEDVKAFHPYLAIFLLKTIERVYASQENLFLLELDELEPLLHFARGYLYLLRGRIFVETANTLLRILNILLYQRVLTKRSIERPDVIEDYVMLALRLLQAPDYSIEGSVPLDTSVHSTLVSPITKSGQSFTFKSEGLFIYQRGGIEIDVYQLIWSEEPGLAALRFVQLAAQLGVMDKKSLQECITQLPDDMREWIQRTTGTSLVPDLSTSIDDFIL